MRRRWEKKWKRTGHFGWQVGAGVAPELAHALDAGWLRVGREVLDAGCGSGENAAWLAGRGLRVLGVDVSTSAIREASVAHHGVAGVEFAVVDVTKPGVLNRQFDAAVDRGCLHGIPEALRPRYAANLVRWVRPGGSLVLTMHTEQKWGAEARRRQVVALLSPAFTIAGAINDLAMGTLGRHPISGVAFHLVRR